MTQSEVRDLVELWLKAAEGVADDAQLNQLNRWLEGDAEARASILAIARQQGWLAWNAGDLAMPAALSAMADAAPALVTNAQRERAMNHGRPLGLPTRWLWAAIAASLVGFLAGRWYDLGQNLPDAIA